MTQFKGSITALVTPFKDGAVDEAAFRSFINWQIEEGTQRPRSRRHDRREPDAQPQGARAGRRDLRRRGEGAGCPVIAGAGSNSTAEAVGLFASMPRRSAPMRC